MDDKAKWLKAVENLREYKVAAKINGDVLTVKKDGKTYTVRRNSSTGLFDFPAELNDCKNDLQTAFKGRRNGGLSNMKDREMYTTKTTLKLLGKTMREDVEEDNWFPY